VKWCINGSAKAAEFLAVDRKAEAEPVPVENGAEHGLEVGEIQIIRKGHDPNYHGAHIAKNGS
jgi:hypothetical protein